MGPTHTNGGYFPVPWARTGPPAHPPPPTGSGCPQRKHALSAGSALLAGKRGRSVSQAFSPDARPRRSRVGECPNLAGLVGTVQGSWSLSGPGAVPGSSAELLALGLAARRPLGVPRRARAAPVIGGVGRPARGTATAGRAVDVRLVLHERSGPQWRARGPPASGVGTYGPPQAVSDPRHRPPGPRTIPRPSRTRYSTP